MVYYRAMSTSPQNSPATLVKISVADPSAIGLLGLAIVTLVASSQKLGLTDGTALVIPWAVFLGACGQIYASVSDSKLGNTFGATAFGAYGLFWLGMAMSWMTQNGVFGETMARGADINQMGLAFVGYLIFTLIMTYGAAGVNKVLFLIFVMIDFLFIGLSVSVFTLKSAGGLHNAASLFAGVCELVISLLSFYACGAAVLNAHFGKTVLPTGAALIKK